LSSSKTNTCTKLKFKKHFILIIALLFKAQTPNVPALETPVREEMFDSSFSLTLSIASSFEEKSLFSAYLDDFQTVSESKKDPVSSKLVKIYADIENFDVTFGRLPLNSYTKKFD